MLIEEGGGGNGFVREKVFQEVVATDIVSMSLMSSRLRGTVVNSGTSTVPNDITRKQVEYCFESTVSEKRTH